MGSRRRRSSRHRFAVAGGGMVAVLLALVVGSNTVAAAARTDAASGSVVVVGVSGLRWDDVSRSGTPTLWRLVGSSAVGSTQVRSARPVTCPLDGWLSVSAGAKATSSRDVGSRDPLNPGQVAGDIASSCRPMPAIASGQVPSWPWYLRLQRQVAGAYGTPGTLGSLLAGAGVCATAIGPGAAVALADADGAVERYAATWSAQEQHACPVTVVDAGALSDAGREEQLAQLDGLLARIVAAAPAGSHLLVTGIADPSASPPPLQVGLEYVAGEQQPGWLTSVSTHGQLGIVALSDVTATVLSRAGIAYQRLPEGTPWESAGDRTLSTTATVQERRDVGALSTVLPADGPRLGAWLAALPLAVLAVCAVAWWARRRAHPWAARPVFSALAVGAALFGAALPTALYVASALRWWRHDNPAIFLGALSVAIAALIALASAYARIDGPWRFVLVQTGVTYGVLSLDGLAGTPLQAASLLGAGPLYGGRFYGFGNVTFAVYATATLLLTAAVAQILVGRGDRRAAVAAAAAIGTVAVLVDGWPAFGADFGGLLALTPGVVLLVATVAGLAVTPTRVALAAASGVVAVCVVAGLDYLRPAEQRSHFGQFVARLVDGSAGDLLTNKLAALGASFASPLGWLEVAGFAVGVAFVLRPTALRLPELAAVFERWPLLRAGLLAAAVTDGIGALVNDSGALVAGLGVVTTVPLLIATCAWWPARPRPAAVPRDQVVRV